MGEFRWCLNLFVLVAIPLVAALDNSMASADICKNYGSDICLCYQNPGCLFPQGGDCVNVNEACGDLQFSARDCRRNGENYASNGVICKFHGKNGGICAAKQISFSLKKALYANNIPPVEEFGQINAVGRDLFIMNERSGLLSKIAPLCLVYKIPVKITGRYQMILRKIRDAPGGTFNILVNGVVIFYEMSGAHIPIGEDIRINYAAEINKHGQVFLRTNENHMLQLEGEFMELSLCKGMCTTAQNSDTEVYMELVDILKFKRHHHHGNEKVIRPKRDATDHIILNVGLDAVTKPNATTTAGTQKPKKPKSSEENSGEKKKKMTTTTAAPASAITTAHA